MGPRANGAGANVAGYNYLQVKQDSQSTVTTELNVSGPPF